MSSLLDECADYHKEFEAQDYVFLQKALKSLESVPCSPKFRQFVCSNAKQMPWLAY